MEEKFDESSIFYYLLAESSHLPSFSPTRFSRYTVIASVCICPQATDNHLHKRKSVWLVKQLYHTNLMLHLYTNNVQTCKTSLTLYKMDS